MKKRLSFIALVILSLTFVSAHVSYVLTDQEFDSNLGSDFMYFLSPLSEPMNLFLIVLTIIVVVTAYVLIPKTHFFKKESKKIEKESKNYTQYIPFIARIGVSIALIGAGTSGVLVSPTLSTISFFGTVQILVGFLMFIGLFTGIAAWAAVALYALAILQTPYMIGNLDFFGLCLVILALGEGKPGVSDIIGAPFMAPAKKLQKYIPKIMAWTIGFAMIYLAVFEKILNPHVSRLVVENYALTSAIPVSAAMWVFAAGIIELAVGFLLLIRFKPRLISAIAFLVLSMSFFYFDEAVYSHITLFVTLFIVFIIGKRKEIKL